jgi:2-methylcitrate dehydratase PrpD
VKVELRDGRVLSQTTGVVRGDAANPMSSDEVVAKFLSLAAERLGGPRAREVVETVGKADALDTVRSLTVLLAPHA